MHWSENFIAPCLSVQFYGASHCLLPILTIRMEWPITHIQNTCRYSGNKIERLLQRLFCTKSSKWITDLTTSKTMIKDEILYFLGISIYLKMRSFFLSLNFYFDMKPSKSWNPIKCNCIVENWIKAWFHFCQVQ